MKQDCLWSVVKRGYFGLLLRLAIIAVAIGLIVSVPVGKAFPLLYCLGMVTGVVSLSVPFTRHGRQLLHWMRVAGWIIGASMIVWSSIHFVLLLVPGAFSPRNQQLLERMTETLEGIGVGIATLLFASGAFKRRHPCGESVADL